MEHNVLDIILALPLIYGFIRGFMNGFIRELAGIAAILAGALTAKFFAADFSYMILEVMTISVRAAGALSYLMLFAGVALLVKALSRTATRFLSKVSLGWLNKLFGGLFGLSKWALVLSGLLNLCLFLDTYVTIIKPEARQSSVLYKPLRQLASIAIEEAKTYTPYSFLK